MQLQNIVIYLMFDYEDVLVFIQCILFLRNVHTYIYNMTYITIQNLGISKIFKKNNTLIYTKIMLSLNLRDQK